MMHRLETVVLVADFPEYKVLQMVRGQQVMPERKLVDISWE